MSLREIYTAACGAGRPNSQLIQLLPDLEAENGSLEEINLSLNFLGVSGFLSLVPVVKHARGLRRLLVPDNNLNNECIHKLVEVLRDHESIEEIDLSRNPITSPGGKDLLALLKGNRRIMLIHISGTGIPRFFSNLINLQLDQNTRAFRELTEQLELNAKKLELNANSLVANAKQLETNARYLMNTAATLESLTAVDKKTILAFGVNTDGIAANAKELRLNTKRFGDTLRPLDEANCSSTKTLKQAEVQLQLSSSMLDVHAQELTAMATRLALTCQGKQGQLLSLRVGYNSPLRQPEDSPRMRHIEESPRKYSPRLTGRSNSLKRQESKTGLVEQLNLYTFGREDLENYSAGDDLPSPRSETSGRAHSIYFEAGESQGNDANLLQSADSFSLRRRSSCALSDIASVWDLSIEVHEKNLHSPALRQRRNALAAPSTSEVDAMADQPMVANGIVAEAERGIVTMVLSNHPLFGHLTDQEIQTALETMTKETFSKGETIYSQGDFSASSASFYVLIQGRAQFYHQSGEEDEVSASAGLRVGDTFGEMGLMSYKTSGRDQTVKAISETVSVAKIDRYVFQNMMASIVLKKRVTYKELLRKISFLKDVSDKQIGQLVDALQPQACSPGEYVIRYGDEGRWFFLILEGQLEVLGRGSGGKRIKVCEFSVGQCVGEMEFIDGQKCVADVVAKGEARLAKISKEHFELIVGRVKDLIVESRLEDDTFRYYNERRQKRDRNGHRLQIVPKPETDRHILLDIFEEEELFLLSYKQMCVAVDNMVRTWFKWGDIITHQDAPVTEKDAFYIVMEGECAMYHNGKFVERFGPGSLLGEVERMEDLPAQATLRVESEKLLAYALDRPTFQRVMKGVFGEKRRKYRELLEEMPILRCMNTKEIDRLSYALQTATFVGGEYLIQYEQQPKWMFILIEGSIEVMGRDEHGYSFVVTTHSEPGSFVGELELLYKHKNVADVRALTDVKVVMLSATHFTLCMGPALEFLKQNCAATDDNFKYYHEHGKFGTKNESPRKNFLAGFEYGLPLPEGEGDLEMPMTEEQKAEADEYDRNARTLFYTTHALRERRGAVVIEVLDLVESGKTFVPKVIPKSPENFKFLNEVLCRSHLFKHLEDREMRMAIDSLFSVNFKSGELLFQQGGHEDTMHVIAEGKCSQLQNSIYKKSLRAGDMVGVEELMFQQPRSYTVRADTEVKTWGMDRTSYRHIMSGIFIKKRSMYAGFLGNVWILKNLEPSQITQLADALQSEQFDAGAYLMRHGQQGIWLYLILEGQVEVWGRNNDNSLLKVCDLGRGQCVGEMELIYNRSAVADAVAKTSVTVAKVDLDHFAGCVGTVKDLLSEDEWKEMQLYNYYKNKTAVASVPESPSGGDQPESAVPRRRARSRSTRIQETSRELPKPETNNTSDW